MTAEALPVPVRRRSRVRTLWVTIRAVLTRELRWRMRGRRAFAIATVFVLLLGLLVFGVHQVLYESALQSARDRFGEQADPMVAGAISGHAAVRIGQAIFGTLLATLTVLVLMIAPALTSGAVSSERERQTMELLVTTPISTLGMLIAKLIGSLAYVLLLILASVPLMSLVFAFGGVSPDDVVRAYLMVLAVAFGVGAIGLFLSTLIGRTQVATVVSYIIVFVLIVGSFALHSWMYLTSVDQQDRGNVRPHAPEMILWLNPVVADIDILCTAFPDVRGTCGYTEQILGLDRGVDTPRDAFWPRSAAAFVVLGCVLTVLATQLVSPSRRWRRRRPRVLAEASPADP
ncbi:MAG: ABC transporter permease subunit [Chloroflexi bacterium]|nr:ABC transporter permease subunit [Chloroflexota bacterium]